MQTTITLKWACGSEKSYQSRYVYGVKCKCCHRRPIEMHVENANFEPEGHASLEWQANVLHPHRQLIVLDGEVVRDYTWEGYKAK